MFSFDRAPRNITNSNSSPSPPPQTAPAVQPPLSLAVYPDQPQSNNLIDAPGSPLPLVDEPEYDPGTEVILPFSFMGSLRKISKAYHDAMTGRSCPWPS